jgi:hypothetical protein
MGIFWIGNALAQKAGPNAVVQARRFDLVDANGRVCATLGTDFQGPYLNFYDNGGRERAAMSLEGSGTPAINLTDSKGRDTRITPPEQDSSAAQDLLLMSTGWGSNKHGQKFVHGSLLNNSGKPLRLAEISLNIYDVRGRLIGSAGDSIKNLEAGGTWVFKAICPHSNAASFKIKEISAR